MRPLSLVPINTLPACNAGAIANAVMVEELQTTSVPPSGKIRKTALRALDTSDRLRAGVVWAVIGEPLSSTAVIVTEVLGVPPSVGVEVGAGAATALELAAASLKART